MTEPQKAQGSTADYCTKWPTEGHSTSVHMRGGALVSVRRCDGCGWIDFADLDAQVNFLLSKTLDLLGDAWGLVCNAGWEASSGRVDLEKTEGWHEAALRLRERYHAALKARYGSSDERDTPRTAPADGTPVRKDPAANAVAYRLGEQREALHAAREIFRALDVENDSGLAFAMGAGATTNIRMWMDRFGKLADPPMVVEVEEDDDEPTTEEPGAGQSSGRWRPLDIAGGAAHLDFAEDTARRTRGQASDA